MPVPKPTPLLFMDCDGTLIKGATELGHFITGPHEVELFDGVFERLREYKSKGWRICMISNQGGIALGHIQDSTVNRIMQEVSRLCGNMFDRMSWCIHHPMAVGKTQDETNELSQCFCRKPRTGLVHAIIGSLSDQHTNEYYRPYSSLFVGDRDEDLDCASQCGIPFISATDWLLK